MVISAMPTPNPVGSSRGEHFVWFDAPEKWSFFENVNIVDEDWAQVQETLQLLQAAFSRAGSDLGERHNIANALAIAQANIESVREGVMEPTQGRLQNVRDALADAQRRMRKVT